LFFRSGNSSAGKRLDGQCAIRANARNNIHLVDYAMRLFRARVWTGTNMSCKARFSNARCFDVRFGPGASGFSEDYGNLMRIRRAGVQNRYTPLESVYHELKPERYGRAYNAMRISYGCQSQPSYRMFDRIHVLHNSAAQLPALRHLPDFWTKSKKVQNEGRI